MKNTEVTKKDIETALTRMVSSFRQETIEKTQEEITDAWYFSWDNKRTVEYNMYMFFDMLELYKKTCRMWEEHHFGSSCVVERVRDKYLIPKITEFKLEMLSKM